LRISVGCKTLLLPVGFFYPIRIKRRFFSSARPRLIPGLAPTVILPVGGLSQGRLAARNSLPERCERRNGGRRESARIFD
jgi:hypothetical protein